MWSRRRRIILVDTIDEVTVAELLAHCRLLSDQGLRRVVIDASSVARCDRAGLIGLVELQQGRGGLEVDLTGVRWSQFFPALQATPLVELQAAHRRIRALIGDEAADDDAADDDLGDVEPRYRGRHRAVPAPTGHPVP